jgi:Rrf2 family iron-sulfur cluster assembly transcriptional regulator
MKILPTRRTDYGIRALLWMARGGDGPATAGEIATGMEIPKGFLHQVLLTLKRAGLVTSRPGRTGGYRLAADPGDISILAIMEALEGPIEDGECAMRGGPCHWQEVCAMHWVWSEARGALVARLKDASLADVSAADLALLAGDAAVPPDSHRAK